MRQRKKLRSDFLFPSTGYLVGMGSVINIFGKYYLFNYSHSEGEADTKALMSDWINVGKDIEESIDNNRDDEHQNINIEP
jgi:hypothetical protein